MTHIEQKHLDAIDKHIDIINHPLCEIVGRFEAAKSCADISIEFAGKFAEWVSEVKEFKKYPEGWCQPGGSNGWHCTTDELITEYTKYLNKQQ